MDNCANNRCVILVVPVNSVFYEIRCFDGEASVHTHNRCFFPGQGDQRLQQDTIKTLIP